MQKLFPGVYRFSVGKRGRSHCYLLVRKQGNILICHANRGSSVVDFLDEVEGLGGIAQQLVCEGADAARGGLHEQLYERFGCRLHCHERDRKKVARKTECPISEFGDEGEAFGRDFRAIDIGHTVFHWSHRGKHFLFPGHAIALHEDAWDIHMHPVSDLALSLATLADLPVDFLLPGRTSASDEEYHTFTDDSRRDYRQVLRDNCRPTKKSLPDRLRSGERVTEDELEPGLPRLLSNYVSAHLQSVIDELGLFDSLGMPGGATGRIDILINSLELADCFFFHDFKREFLPKHKFWDMLRTHVAKGGTLLINDARRVVNDRWIAGGHPFPEIAVWSKAAEDPGTELTVCAGHPAIGEALPEARFHSDFYHGMSLEPGDQGSVLARNSSGRPVAVAGEVGKGRVVFGGFFYHPHRDPVKETERQLVEGIFRWLAP
ncbi:MAG: hypothetical protein HN404_19430 [Gemmatimonadetes bacterium]|jgi:hypothetical protein|nr:hypothetical protein [Gemmatimonadota bacterium]